MYVRSPAAACMSFVIEPFFFCACVSSFSIINMNNLKIECPRHISVYWTHIVLSKKKIRNVTHTHEKRENTNCKNPISQHPLMHIQYWQQQTLATTEKFTREKKKNGDAQLHMLQSKQIRFTHGLCAIFFSFVFVVTFPPIDTICNNQMSYRKADLIKRRPNLISQMHIHQSHFRNINWRIALWLN